MYGRYIATKRLHLSELWRFGIGNRRATDDHMIAESYVYDLICERAASGSSPGSEQARNEWKQTRKRASERMTGSRLGSERASERMTGSRLGSERASERSDDRK